MIVSGGRDASPASTPAPAASTPAPAAAGPQTAAATPPRTDATSPAPGRSASAAPPAEIDLTPPAGHGPVRKATWGLAPAPCTQHEQQLVDLDTGESRVERERDGAVENPGGAELLYWPDTCTGIGDYVLRGLPNTRVGLLRADAPRTAEACRAAAGTGFGPLPLFDTTRTKQRGFAVGAAVCAVTAEGAVSMATIEHLSGGSTTDVSVSGSLYVWPKAG
ncbi:MULTISPECIES: hypothetical protein [unclassified Streptomyces]|uniref:hypothetical protein n=1 Tax=unclassified Streptomyces TaxID=2593676 RepID=UPI00225612D6|nr:MULTISPECIES: hypothetical protein [unclassified Streptomyces]MCX4525603.1 hypothetical protein [Streptomyces sp. NBC_01551]MCX4543925.1 hypothetical protein [Streptomyces sp. NBC_01565]